MKAEKEKRTSPTPQEKKKKSRWQKYKTKMVYLNLIISESLFQNTDTQSVAQGTTIVQCSQSTIR